MNVPILGCKQRGATEDRLGENDLFMAHGKYTTESSRAEVRDQVVQVVCKLYKKVFHYRKCDL